MAVSDAQTCAAEFELSDVLEVLTGNSKAMQKRERGTIIKFWKERKARRIAQGKPKNEGGVES
jgi:hypothetical protein